MRFKAFTILEFAVTLVLTSIVASLGYEGIILFSKQSQQQTRKTDHSNELITLQYLLNRDALESQTITRHENQIHFHKSDNSLTYDIQSGLVRRLQASVIDTFEFQFITMESRFRNEPVYDGIIDQVDLITLLEKDSISFSTHKTYSLSTLMNYQDSLENRN